MVDRDRCLAVLCLAFTIACGTPLREESGEVERPSGLILSEPGATPGYVLYAPLMSDTTYLIDAGGLVVHTWKSRYAPEGTAYLLPNGHILRGARVESKVFKGGGTGGLIEEYTWEGELAWSFPYATDDHMSHHDIEPLPNGNVLAIAWERKTAEEARAAGRRPDFVPEQGLWPDKLVEIEPARPEGGSARRRFRPITRRSRGAVSSPSIPSRPRFRAST